MLVGRPENVIWQRNKVVARENDLERREAKLKRGAAPDADREHHWDREADGGEGQPRLRLTARWSWLRAAA
jgi:hypothetical protein